jgi:hydroxymethylbilane synthase
LAQAKIVVDLLQAHHPGIQFDVHPLQTEGDRISAKRSLPHSGKALFTGAIERALIAGRVDMAVHSYKDMANGSPDELAVAAVPPREDARDALVSRRFPSLDALPERCRIGTSSLRRAAQVRAKRPLAIIEELHGNVETRLRTLDERGWDGIVLAAAGLKRLGLHSNISQVLSPDDVVPAPAQGALAIQTRRDDDAQVTAATIDDPATRVCVEAERRLSAALGGDCNVPFGALAHIEADQLVLDAMVADPTGRRVLRARLRGPIGDWRRTADAALRQLLDQGAGPLLEAVR